MSTSILTTKLYLPPRRSAVVLRPRLIQQLNEGLRRRLTLTSAPAGFGKTTLVSEWVTGSGQPAAWLSLDEEDNDPPRFLSYVIAALQTISMNTGAGLLGMLQSPQPPPIESVLTTLLNEITSLQYDFILVLDDYHAIQAKPVDRALTFLLEHQPPQMYLVIATRDDRDLPLARLRAHGQLSELRVADLRFTPSEAAEFLNQVMRLDLSDENIAALEARTEGWVAGLQLAAISMQGYPDVTSFIQSFTGSHRFVMDYLLEEVLGQQCEDVQKFMLHTSILNRLCGPLCDAVLFNPSPSGQETLEYLERANLILIPLDNERRWYRYHHLFADLLRQKLRQSVASSDEDDQKRLNELHIRASQWYEDNGLELEAFHHAAAAGDVVRAERLIEGKIIPLHFSGAIAPMDKEQQYFQKIAEKVAAENKKVTIGKMMTSPGLRYKNRFFAFYYKKQMVFRFGRDFDPKSMGIKDYSLLAPFKTRPPLVDWFEIPASNMKRWEELALFAMKRMHEHDREKNKHRAQTYVTCM